MSRRRVFVVVALLAFVGLGGCGPRTKEDLVERARGVETRPELEKKLGRPQDITKVGPIETWTYRASNGNVVFVIIADRVTLQAAGETERRGR